MGRFVQLGERQQRFVLQCCNEVGGGSAREYLAIAGHDAATIRAAAEDFRVAMQAAAVSLPESTWRVLYNSINAAIYALGPAELHTVTGFLLSEAADVQLRLCSNVWGAYGEATWAGESG